MLTPARRSAHAAKVAFRDALGVDDRHRQRTGERFAAQHCIGSHDDAKRAGGIDRQPAVRCVEEIDLKVEKQNRGARHAQPGYAALT